MFYAETANGLDLGAISEKIQNKVYNIQNKRKCRSLVWDIFGEIADENGEIIPDIVGCRTCFAVSKFKSHSTTSLMRHDSQWDESSI